MLAFALAVSITPGAREIALDAAHWLVDGHLAHTDGAHADACDDGESDEHGCTGAFHTCACHASVSMADPPRLLEVRAIVPLERDAEYAASEARRGPSGHPRRLIRPPAA